MSSEYTTSVASTNSPCNHAIAKIENDLPAESGSMVRRACIPVEIMQEIDAANLHGIVKDLVFWIVYRCLTTRSKCCAIHQGLIDASLNSDRRKELMRFLKASKYIRPAMGGLYRPGRQAKRYELHSLPILSESEYQHNNEIVCDGDLSCVDGVVVWRSVDFGPLLEAIGAGWVKKGWDRSKNNAEWSLEQCDETTLTADEIVAEKAEEPVVATQHAAQHERYRDKTTDGVFRKDGRVYTSVTSLPKWIRERVVKFGGESETIDVSCCYLWVLSAEHRASLVRRGLSTQEVDTLLEMIERGNFYHVIAESAGVETLQAKREFNTFCLFGPIGFHPLWHALNEICPGICRDIRWWRSQAGGATRLAHFLQRAEGALMTDGLIDWLVSGGIPAVQVHDGCIIPAGVADVAAEWLNRHSTKAFGRGCRVKITKGGAL
jgi:hypothetical protein